MLDGEKVGSVEDLLIDDSGAVRYLDVDLGARHGHILIPLERTRADEAEMVVWVPGLSRSRLHALPRYDHDPDTLTAEYEARLDEAYREGWSEPRGAPGVARRPRAARAGTGIEIAPRRGGAERYGALTTLSESGEYEVVPGDPDPRGWAVLTHDGRRIGQVHDLVIEPEVGKVRYLECEVTFPIGGRPAGGQRILIPVESTRLDLDENLVLADGIRSTALADYPSFFGLPLAPEDEERIHEIIHEGSRGDRDRS